MIILKTMSFRRGCSHGGVVTRRRAFRVVESSVPYSLGLDRRCWQLMLQRSIRVWSFLLLLWIRCGEAWGTRFPFVNRHLSRHYKNPTMEPRDPSLRRLLVRSAPLGDEIESSRVVSLSSSSTSSGSLSSGSTNRTSIDDYANQNVLDMDDSSEWLVSSSVSSFLSLSLPPFVKVIGVTGGIGSGKSTACRILTGELLERSLHLDADSIAHSLYRGNHLKAALLATFGPKVLHRGEIDRKALADIIFRDLDARKRLERIVWPLTKLEICKRIQLAAQEWERNIMDNFTNETGTTSTTTTSFGVVVVEAALLLEAGWQDILDETWFISVERHVALQRLVQGDRKLDPEEAQRRMAAQESRILVNSTVITAQVDNSGTPQALRDGLRCALEIAQESWKKTALTTFEN